MKERPLIGIVGWKTGDNSFGVTIPYLNHLSNFGDIVVLNPMRGIISDLDLVILPGGKDSPSFLYGVPPNYANGDSDQFKEWFAHNNLDQYINAGVPIFGTCLGMQQLIIHFGGSLCQNLINHAFSNEFRGEPVHELVFTHEYMLLEAKLLARRKKDKVIKTCSLHHQGAYQENIPECFNIIATTKDKVVEVIEHKTLPIAGCQGHTEEDWNPLGNYLIGKLLRSSPNFKNENTGNSTAVQNEAS